MSDGPRPPESDDDFDYDRIFVEEEERPIGPSLRQRMPLKRIKRLAIGAAAAIVFLTVALFFLRLFNPGGPPTGETNLTIAQGTGVNAIAEQLDDAGVIPSATAFKLWIRKEGDDSFQAGEYRFRNNMSAGEALAVLRSGPKQEVRALTIPEGLRLEQIAERVGRLPGFSAQKFLEVANSGQVSSFLSPPGSTNLEGLLFPDTYFIGNNDTELSLLRRMVATFEDQARSAGIENSLSTRSRTPYEIAIIASMIESEARVPEDRGKISQVIDNRLRQDMPLQIDATVLYALGNNKNSVSFRDLEVRSDYNTYRRTGLPPAPISNPGVASIRAALEPTPGPWLYYVVKDEAGAHAFSTTFAEHEQRVDEAQAKNLY